MKNTIAGTNSGCGIFLHALKVLLHGIVEEGETVIKDRSRDDNPAAAVVAGDAEVAKMTVIVVNDRIEDEHDKQVLIAAV